MSTEYNFYAGKKNKEGKYEFLGPYFKNVDGEMKIDTLFWRSQSFIKWDEFEAIQIPVEKMDTEVAEYCSYNLDWSDDKNKVYSYGYWISYKDLLKKAKDGPIRGFLPIEEAQALIVSNYDPEFIEWGMESQPVPAEFIAGLTNEERSKYGFVSYIDHNTIGYQANFIARALDEYGQYGKVDEDETYGVIVQVG